MHHRHRRHHRRGRSRCHQGLDLASVVAPLQARHHHLRDDRDYLLDFQSLLADHDPCAVVLRHQEVEEHEREPRLTLARARAELLGQQQGEHWVQTGEGEETQLASHFWRQQDSLEGLSAGQHQGPTHLSSKAQRHSWGRSGSRDIFNRTFPANLKNSRQLT